MTTTAATNTNSLPRGGMYMGVKSKSRASYPRHQLAAQSAGCQFKEVLPS